MLGRQNVLFFEGLFVLKVVSVLGRKTAGVKSLMSWF